jgi:protein-disulfide isomerase
MERSTVAQWLAGIAIAILLGFLAGRQQQLADVQREILLEIQALKNERGSGPVGGTPLNTSLSETPQEFDIKIEGAATAGKSDARVVLIEFSDFECPYCERYTKETYPRIERDYVNAGKIRYVFRHYPLTDIHLRAMKAAQAAECARQQGKFWPMHNRLFANRKALDQRSLMDYAKAIGLDMKPFETCLNGKAAAATVLADIDTGTRAGITATPTFFVGVANPDGSVHVINRIVGAREYETFQAALDGALARPASPEKDSR